jgi:hypothetical protein
MWPECREHPLVILSEAKDLTHWAEILRFAQDDTGEPIRLFLFDKLMVQSAGSNGWVWMMGCDACIAQMQHANLVIRTARLIIAFNKIVG